MMEPAQDTLTTSLGEFLFSVLKLHSFFDMAFESKIVLSNMPRKCFLYGIKCIVKWSWGNRELL
jgi:hypothetical protein